MSIGEQAKRVYESRLKAELEAKHRDRFVAIELVSESFFLGRPIHRGRHGGQEGIPGSEVVRHSRRP